MRRATIHPPKRRIDSTRTPDAQTISTRDAIGSAGVVSVLVVGAETAIPATSATAPELEVVTTGEVEPAIEIRNVAIGAINIAASARIPVVYRAAADRRPNRMIATVTRAIAAPCQRKCTSDHASATAVGFSIRPAMIQLL